MKDQEMTDNIGFLVKKINTSLQKSFQKDFKEEGLTKNQFEVIGYLREREGRSTTVKDIEKFLAVNQPTASGIVKRMEAAGLVACREDPSDRRRKLVSLKLEDGKWKEFREDAPDRMELRMLSGLSGAEQKELKRMLRQVLKNLENGSAGN